MNKTTTPSQLDLVYLAAIIDGEGCIAFMRRTDYRPEHRLEVRYDVKIAMTCRETIVDMHKTISEIVGEDLVKVFLEKRKIPRRRPLWRCEVSSKQGVYGLLKAVEPYMRTKKLKAQLCLCAILKEPCLTSDIMPTNMIVGLRSWQQQSAVVAGKPELRREQYSVR